MQQVISPQNSFPIQLKVSTINLQLPQILHQKHSQKHTLRPEHQSNFSSDSNKRDEIKSVHKESKMKNINIMEKN